MSSYPYRFYRSRRTVRRQWPWPTLALGHRQRRRLGRLASALIATLMMTLHLSGLSLWHPQTAWASPSLTIEPITWDFIGLDSNNVNSGPNTYLVGARICNVGSSLATNVQAKFVRQGAINPYITLQGNDTITIPSLPAGGPAPNRFLISYTPTNCYDAYYNVVVTRDANARNTSQPYVIQATADGVGTVSTPANRQLYVERLLAQARNSVESFTNLTTGSNTVEVGKTYRFELRGRTATSYPQLVLSSDFPNIIFELLGVETTYSLPGGGINSTTYADACGWIADYTNPGYRRSSSVCQGPPNYGSDGKAGGQVSTIYTIKVLSIGEGNVGSTQVQINHLILDFSGGSYHYNASFGSGLGITTLTVVDRQADLSLQKTHQGNFTTGQNTYRLQINNSGPDPAEGPISLTDTLPQGFSYVGVGADADSQGWSCSASGQTVTCTHPTAIPNGGSRLLNLLVNVADTAPSNSVNTATVTSVTRDANPANNTDTDPTTVVQGPNISLTKTHGSATPFVAGETGTYTLTVANTSTFDAAGPLTLIDTLPPGLSFASASGVGWTCESSGSVVTCISAAGLNAGTSTAVNVVVNISADVPTPNVTNTASVSSSSFDPNPADNTATVVTPTSLKVPDLVIAKTDNDLNFAQNADGAYTITVTNIGLAPTTELITVEDTLPASFTYVSAVSATGYSGWSCTYSAPKVTCTHAGPLVTGERSSIRLVVRPTATGSFTNLVTVSTPGETNTANNTATDNTTVESVGNNAVDLNVVKTIVTAPIGPNTAIQYAVELTNTSSGNGDDTSIRLVDVVPPEITGVTWNCTFMGTTSINLGNGSPSNHNSCTNGSGSHTASGTGNNINITTISLRKGGGKVRVTISGTVGNYSGPLANTATVTPSSGTDKTPDNNVSTVNTSVAGPDLTISKAPLAPLVQTVNGVYRLTVTNVGPISTTGAITVTDTLPLGLTYVSAASAPGSTGWYCTYNTTSGTVTCSNSSITLAQNATSSIDLTVVPTVATAIINSATVSTPGDTNATNNTGSNTATPVAANPDLRLTKAGPASFDLGQPGSYTLTLENVGTTVATAPLTITDTLPAGLSYLASSSSGWSCAAAGQIVTCTRYSNLAAAASTTLVLQVMVGSNTADSIQNQATVAAVSGETVLDNNTATVTIPVNQQADLSLTKTLTQALVVGQQGEFQLVVKNLGPSDLTQPLTVTDTLPADLSFNALSGTGWACQNVATSGICGTGATQLALQYSGGLKVGETATVTLTVAVADGISGNRPNTATVSSPLADPDSDNNTASAPATLQPKLAALTLTKTDNEATFVHGQTGQYLLTLTNQGPAVATAPLTITDTLPGGLTWVTDSLVGAGWSCSGSTTVTCTSSNNLAARDSTALNLTVAVGSNTPVGTVTNQATATSATNPGDSATAMETTTVTAGANLAIAKTGSNIVAGEAGTYTLTVTNSGPGTAVAPRVIDFLPLGVTLTGTTAPDWSCNSAFGDLVCDRTSDLASGATSTITLAVTTATDATGSLENVADVDSVSGDPDLTNNRATYTVNLDGSSPDQRPEVRLVKRITAINDTVYTDVIDGEGDDDNHPHWPANYLQGIVNAPIQPGDQLEYTVYFLSSGEVAAQDVLICDRVPAPLTYVVDGFNHIAAAPGGTAEADRGILLKQGIEASLSLTNLNDGDRGQFVAPDIELSTLQPRLSNCGDNTQGAVVVMVGDLPASTGAGAPAGAYGYIRFRGDVP
jgi:uncharacterized repeat protein (TIGR01451 family)